MNEDKLIFNSASNFKERFKQIIDEKLQVYKSWRELHEKFLSKEGEITLSKEKKKDFN